METFISWFTIAIVYGTILSLSACGETINEKAGHLNLGIPGISVTKCKKILSELPLERIFGWLDRGLSSSYVTDAVADIDGFGMKSAIFT